VSEEDTERLLHTHIERIGDRQTGRHTRDIPVMPTTHFNLVHKANAAGGLTIKKPTATLVAYIAGHWS